jgi:hypothetical protein
MERQNAFSKRQRGCVPPTLFHGLHERETGRNSGVSRDTVHPSAYHAIARVTPGSQAAGEWDEAPAGIDQETPSHILDPFRRSKSNSPSAIVSCYVLDSGLWH